MKRFLPGIIWLIISTVLLTLPGDDFPNNGLFGIKNLDKVVHTGMFALLCFLFALPFSKSDNLTLTDRKKTELIVVISVIIYGFLIELVQEYWAINRSFDLLDICFDAVGSIIGITTCRLLAKK